MDSIADHDEHEGHSRRVSIPELPIRTTSFRSSTPARLRCESQQCLMQLVHCQFRGYVQWGRDQQPWSLEASAKTTILIQMGIRPFLHL